MSPVSALQAALCLDGVHLHQTVVGPCSLQMRALVEMENSGLVVLLEQDQYDDLARMYSLFKRLDDGLGLIRKMMGDHLKAAGSALVQDPESTKDPVDFVHRLLAMKDKYDRYGQASHPFLQALCT